jgi:hypothetical protein
MVAPAPDASKTPDAPSAASGRVELVFTAGTVPEGLLARGLLESEGITVLTKGEGEGPYRMGPMLLFVPEELAIQARLILESAVLEAGDWENTVETDCAD